MQYHYRHKAVLSFVALCFIACGSFVYGQVTPLQNVKQIREPETLPGLAVQQNEPEAGENPFVTYLSCDKSRDYYQVQMSELKTDFEKLYFLELAVSKKLYIRSKSDWNLTSAVFYTKEYNREEAIKVMQELYRAAVIAEITMDNTSKAQYVASSEFIPENSANQDARIEGPNANPICEDAEVACSQNTYTFPSGNQGTAPPPVNGYPYYGCLSSQPAPAWYFMQVQQNGDIIINIEQVDLTGSPIDVDFICWGPFTSLTAGCSNGLTAGNVVDCSYSPDPFEVCDILNAQVGEIYILLMTNFAATSGHYGTITFSQTGGSGITNCDIVLNCSILAITTDVSVCNPATNSFSVSGNIEFTNPPETGTLTITDSTALPVVSQTFTAPFNSPLAYSLSNITCDGQQHALTAVFSADTSCKFTQTYNAPQASCPQATISGGGPVCDDGVSTVPVSINVTGSGPFTFIILLTG